jgi:hypothetical protein
MLEVTALMVSSNMKDTTAIGRDLIFPNSNTNLPLSSQRRPLATIATAARLPAAMMAMIRPAVVRLHPAMTGMP